MDERAGTLAQPIITVSLESKASAYLAGSGGPELLPAAADGPDTPATANTQGGPGRLYQLNREERTGSLVA